VSGRPAPRLSVSTRVSDPRWRNALPGLSRFSGRILAFAAGRIGLSGTVDLLYTSDEEVRGLNARWRGKDKPTDILSFPAMGLAPPGEPVHVGDLVLACETTLGDAAGLGRPPEAHVAHLLIHGLLHLAGYDHEREAEAVEMEGMEARLLGELGYPDPYVVPARRAPRRH